jgi:hypothetical protein
VRRGVYAEANEWASADPAERYIALIRASGMGFLDDRVVSHQSAAALWGLPLIGAASQDVHLLVPKATGGRSDPGIRRHALGVSPEDVTVIDGIPVTTLARTLVDVATTEPLYWAVCAIDHALYVDHFSPAPMITKLELLEQWERMLPFRGHARAHHVLSFAETGSGSPSETGSRVSIALAGFPAPVLQQHFVVDGRDVWTDFFWERERAIGECDGQQKYVDPALRGGRTLEEVLLAEKAREDGLRRQVLSFQRWGSAEAFSPTRLRPKLLEMGLRPSAPRLRGR